MKKSRISKVKSLINEEISNALKEWSSDADIPPQSNEVVTDVVIGDIEEALSEGLALIEIHLDKEGIKTDSAMRILSKVEFLGKEQVKYLNALKKLIKQSTM